MNPILLIVCCFFLSSYLWADNGSDIQLINKKVADIEKNKRQLNYFEVAIHSEEIESVPPIARFYYSLKTENLLILQVDVGHEIFLNRFTYYFDNDVLIKYVKESLNHPDAPPKEAVIYNDSGLVLWKNTNEPLLDSRQIQNLFMLNMNALKSFSRY